MNKKTLNISILCCLFLGQTVLYGQMKSNAKFGKITPADFDLSGQSFDTAAEAVVIADIGSSAFQGNSKGRFSLEFRHFRRMKILNKKGFDAATVTIHLYSSGEKVERLENLKAVTYNLENGQIVQTKLDDKSVFTTPDGKHFVDKKFTFPAVKEGSIIEYSYVQSSDFIFNLQPWAFQGGYPCFWSEYTVDIPNFYDYVFLSQGYEPFAINTNSSSHQNFHATIPGGAGRDEGINFDDDVVTHHWVMKNLPALKPERFTTTYRNYIAKIEFQLNRIQYPEQPFKSVMPNWPSICEELFKSEYFGADLDRNNGWLDEDMKAITMGAATQLEKAKKIYDYVRDHFACTSYGGQEADQPIKTIFKNKSGNAPGLNLLLIAMLVHENIPADPILLSTRENGYSNELYPLMDRYNYVVCQAKIDTSVYFLDASRPWQGFGHLPGYCYNGQARVINKDHPAAVYFRAGELKEGKNTMILLTDDGKGGFEGSYESSMGYAESSNIREQVHNKGEKGFFEGIRTAYAGTMTIANTTIDSLKLTDEPIKVSYSLTFKPDTTEDVLYFNPMLPADMNKENPFKAAERKYPVEMPYTVDETYTLNMEIPPGYTVEELPRSAKVLFNTDEGFFEYLIQKDPSYIQFRSRIRLLRADFRPEDYSGLRDFYAFIVKKQSEQIVFKKKTKS